ncbi:MAG: hypothetical protein HC877_10890 [Thioploca sp.]|nr:hypothetical protein [Thioploca sp.]
MFKALTNLILLFLLVLINMSLFTWCINQFNLNQTPLKKTLISNVQAEATTGTTPILSIHRVPTRTPRLILRQVPHPTTALTHDKKPKQRLQLRFQSVAVQPDKNEQVKLENMLQQLKITHSHAAKILFGPAPFTNNTSSPQIAKLRAQNIARIIYPYTQIVKMSYHTTLKEGEVIIEFFEPQSA